MGSKFALSSWILHAGLLLGCLPSVASAQSTFNWNNASGGSFHTASNWTPAGPPGPLGVATFDLAPSDATYTVTMSASVINLALRQPRNTVTLDMSPGTQYTLFGYNSWLGYNGTAASFNVNGGTMVLNEIILGYDAGSAGTLRFSGPTTGFVSQYHLYVGGEGDGEGTLVLQSGAAGAVSDCTIGYAAASNGKVQVLGPGSSLAFSGTTYVGNDGTGLLHIDPEAVVVNTGSITLARNAGSNGTVDVYGTWNNSGVVNFGAGTGTINLNGGTLSLQGLNLNGGTFNFNEGTVRINNDWTGNFTQVTGLLGSGRSLSEGKTLEVGGTATLQSLIRLQGGTLRVGSLVGASNLSWSAGLVDITGSDAQIGSGGQWTTLNLSTGMHLKVSDSERALFIASDGVLNLNGGVASGALIFNSGEIHLGSASSTLGQTGQFLNNNGRIVGTGRVNADLGNFANGRIIVDAGQRLVFRGTDNNNFAGGTLELSGGTLEFTNTLTNYAGGFISGRGVLRGSSANTSGTGLNNLGNVAFSGGFSDIYGKVNNDGTGQIIAAGGGVLTFHDDVIHNGTEIRTTAGSRTVFLGEVSGAGAFTGTGTVEYQGDLRPGNSPANVFYSGGVVIGASATSYFEIGGSQPGSEYDRLTIAGSVSLDGGLEISLLNGFTPFSGQQFTLIDNQGTNPIEGTFFRHQRRIVIRIGRAPLDRELRGWRWQQLRPHGCSRTSHLDAPRRNRSDTRRRPLVAETPPGP